MVYNLGYKGSKGESDTKQPTRLPDDLRSEDTVEILLGLSEGEIEGLEDGLRSFYVGETALVSATDQPNFENFALEIYSGTEVPSKVNFVFGGSASSTTVGVTLDQGVSVVRTTGPADNIDAIDIRLVVNALYKVTDEGDTLKNTVRFRIEYKLSSSGTWLPLPQNQDDFADQQQIKGKTTSPYAKEIRFPVARAPGDTYDIRITKISDDTDGKNNFSELAWESFQIVELEERRYPNTALAHLVARASNQFSSVPQFKGIYKLKRIKVPSIYDPVTRNYDFSGGPWDGTFQTAWTDNAAWILYDIVMNDRYGINAYFPVSLNKYDVLEAALWCDACDANGNFVGVDDGQGGVQPRFTYNGLIQDARNGREQAHFMAGLFNARFYDALDGTARLKVDKPGDAVHAFSQANVVDGDINYTFTDITTRYNDITVTYLNRDIQYQEDRRRVFDQDAINQHGRIPLDFIATGCTNTQEAVRRAVHKLITAQNEKINAVWTTNRQGLYLEPFDLVYLYDEDMNWGISDRIKTIDAARTGLSLRDGESVYLEAGITYELRVWNGAAYVSELITPATDGEVSSFTLSAALPVNYPDNPMFTLEDSVGTSIGKPQMFRIISFDESNDNETVQVSAVEVYEDKWTDIDAQTSFIGIENLGNFNGSLVQPPANVSASIIQKDTGDGARIDIQLDWDQPTQPIKNWNVQWALNGVYLGTMSDITDNSYYLEGAKDGLYQFSVQAVNSSGVKSPWTIVEFDVDAAALQLPLITNLRLIEGNYDRDDKTKFWGNAAEFTWDLQPFETWTGAAAGAPYPNFTDYKVEILDTNDNVLRTEYVTSNYYIYTAAKNALDGGGTPRRDFKIRVALRDEVLTEGTSTTFAVSNPAPSAPTISANPGINAIYVHLGAPPDKDWEGTLVWLSDTAGIDPLVDAPSYDTRQTDMAIEVDGDSKYYLVTAYYDSFGKIDLNYTTEVQVTSSSVTSLEQTFQFSGIRFEPNKPSANSVSWTAGSVLYGLLGQAPVTKAISAGNAAYTGSPLYIYYDVNDTALRTTTNIAVAFEKPGRVVAVYHGGTDIVVGNGDAFLDGQRVIAGTVGANQLVTNEAVITGSAQIKDAIINTAHVDELSADKLVAGTISALISIGVQNIKIDGVNNRIVISD